MVACFLSFIHGLFCLILACKNKMAPWLGSLLVRVYSRYANVACLIPDKGIYKNQPIYALMSGTIT